MSHLKHFIGKEHNLKKRYVERRLTDGKKVNASCHIGESRAPCVMALDIIFVPPLFGTYTRHAQHRRLYIYVQYWIIMDFRRYYELWSIPRESVHGFICG